MIDKFIVRETDTIGYALKRLNELHSISMTLFVTDNKGKMVGSFTDGDIRRALIKGISTNELIKDAMNSNFRALMENDITTLRELRSLGISLIPILDSEGHIKQVIDLTKSKSALPIDAVLMAGGKGERLRPLTLTTPKPLLKIGEQAIIDRNIERLIDYGIQDISVTVNYLKEMLIKHFIEPIRGIEVKCVSEECFLGTIGSLKLIPDFKNDTILVMNSDILTDINFEDFYLHFREHDAMMSAVAVPYTISVPYGIFDLQGRNIKGISEKPVFNYYANAGIYLIKKECLAYIPDNEVFNATDLIEALVADGKRVIRFPLTSLWIDIGTPDEFQKAYDLVKHLNTSI